MQTITSMGVWEWVNLRKIESFDSYLKKEKKMETIKKNYRVNWKVLKYWDGSGTYLLETRP
jgi:hypothetical protein